MDKSICHFRGVRSILSLFLFLMVTLLVNNVDPDQTPDYVAFDLGLHCLPVALFTDFQLRMG